MKARLLIILMPFLLTSCINGYYKYRANHLIEKTYIGMSEDEFKNIFKRREIESIDQGYKCYRVNITDFADVRYDRFFYFYNGKLYSVNKGIRPLDYRMRIN